VAKVSNFSIFGNDENDIKKGTRVFLRADGSPVVLYIWPFFYYFSRKPERYHTLNKLTGFLGD
jgi:hypothetical protein